MKTLHDIAIARSGDKGNRATLSVICIDPQHYPLLERLLTAERVQALYRGVVLGRVQRHLLPHLGAVHFVMDEALAGGVTRSLALDAHGKTLSSAILDVALDSPVNVPAEVPAEVPEKVPEQVPADAPLGDLPAAS